MKLIGAREREREGKTVILIPSHESIRRRLGEQSNKSLKEEWHSNHAFSLKASHPRHPQPQAVSKNRELLA